MNFSLFSFLNQIQSFFSKTETPMTDSTWEEIPETVMAELEKLVNQLPDPSFQMTELKEAILSQLKQWEDDENVNHLVILGSPTADLKRLISASFPETHLKKVEVIYPLSDQRSKQAPSV